MLTVAVFDVGGRNSSGWFRTSPLGDTEGSSLDELCGQLVADLQARRSVALGFEAPLWIPYATHEARLRTAREGEAGVGRGWSRPWSIHAGAYATANGIQQTTYALHRIATELRAATPRVTFDPERLRAGDADLLVWEAFVTGAAKTGSHIGDAMSAATAFRTRWDAGPVTSDVTFEPAISLAGLAAHVSGLSADPALLTAPPVVVCTSSRV